MLSAESTLTPARTTLPVMKEYRCAICDRAVSYDGRLPADYPFCSERCRLVDLDNWFRERYTLDRDMTGEDLLDNHLPTMEDADDWREP